MSSKAQSALVWLLVNVGAAILLVGIFTELYPVALGLALAIAIWIIAATLSSVWRVKAGKPEKHNQVESPMYDSRCREALKQDKSGSNPPWCR